MAMCRKRYGIDPGAAPTEIQADARKVRENAFLEEIYRDSYERMSAELPEERYPNVLEIGSGGGFLREIIPRVTTSECTAVPGIDRVVDACKIDAAFGVGELDAICALNVFHHLPDAAGFLRGAERVLRPGGRIVLVEPYFTRYGRWFHKAIHHEPHVEDPNFWGIIGDGRMEAANSRLPTSVFRDSAARFAKEFPELVIVKREPFHKWLYLFSGGLRLNTRVPRFIARHLLHVDRRTKWGDEAFGIFAVITVDRR